MQYKLRDYQKDASDRAFDFLTTKSKRNGLLLLPTGSGKSLIIADIAHRLPEPTLIFQPSKEILEQNFAKLQAYGIWDCSVFSASFNSKNISRITFATIGSVKSHPELFKHFKNVLIDECHLVNPKQGMYSDFLETLSSKVLGLTATPYRLNTDGYGGSMLKFLTRTRPRVFHDVIYHAQIGDLAQRGYLAKMEYFPLQMINTKRLKINTTGADYTDQSVRIHYREVNFESKVCGIVKRLLKAGRKNVLVFTRFVEEAQTIVDNLPGIADIVSGTTPKKDREQKLSDFKAGKIQVIANCGVLTTGFDFPELDTIVIARPTMSLALYYQMIGRAMRPHPGKESAWIIDLCENYERFGAVEDLVINETNPGIWTIRNPKKQLTNVYYD